MSNLQLMCPPCNRAKGDQDEATFFRKRGFLF